ncbi:Fur family transcriptional regulator [Calorimonas adulescens]|uniref:Transcriptional repressor n=1 Tax=Calorimonas adulescens TaxID=2606906 RepID=A0A5D8QA69_9THEO|nr:Fur family transcriptional regulator [Calorimonas adulescens]TZE81029.1 transcriptional repressor [Calorimonas adulescens]
MDIEKSFREKGVRLTHQRRVLIDTLRDAHRAMTAQELYREARMAWPHINFSTIYRNIETLKSVGLICEMTDGIGNTLFAYRDEEEHHHHLVCKGCGKTISFDSCPLIELKQVLDETGFMPTGHRFEVYGYCKECRKDRV